MVWLCLCIGLVLGVSAACSDRSKEQPAPAAADTNADHVDAYRWPGTTVVPENEDDRLIRRNLNLAISRDPSLRDRQISFLVSNGDVSVTGIVKSEGERKKINDLAMNINGVKSVANALRVSE
jgi:osmotically-inducible protein OsmY